MTVKVRLADASRFVAAIGMRDFASLKPVREIYARDKNNNRVLLFASLKAVASPTLVEGSGNSPGGISITTESATCSGQNGAGGYSYAWSGDADWTILSPNSATTAFRKSNVGPGFTDGGNFVCTVTDSSGATAVSNPVTAQATNVNAS